MSKLQEVDDAHFAAEVLESELPVLVEFTAAWCAPCRIMKPVLQELAEERADMRVVTIDVDTNPLTGSVYGVMAMPTFILFRGGEPALTLIGARPKAKLERELAERDAELLAEQGAGR